MTRQRTIADRLPNLPRKPFPFAELPTVAPPVDVTDAEVFPNIAEAVEWCRQQREKAL